MRFLRTLLFAILTYAAAHVAATPLTGEPTPTTESFPVTKANSTGLRRLLYLRVVFPDQLVEPISEQSAAANLATMTDFYQENSYGKVSFLNTIAPVVMLPHTFAWYKNDYQLNNPTQLAFPSVLMGDAKEAARAAGYPADTYNQIVVHFLGGFTGNWSGIAASGGSDVCITTPDVGTLEHEIGHNMGSKHAEFWNTSGASVAGPGTNVDYGSTNDVMGGYGSGGHLNAALKDRVWWLRQENYFFASESGTYRIFQIDQANLDPSRRYALKVAKDLSRAYHLEFRQNLNTNPWFTNGVMIHWNDWGTTGNPSSTLGSFGGTQLLDLTVGSPDDRADAPLTIGRTYSDYEEDVHLTPIGKGGTTPESMDVVVNLGTMNGNTAPTLALSASSLAVAAGVPVDLAAVTTDPDGDTLAYFWDFGDKLVGFNGSSFSTNNAATQSKIYGSAGYYLVRCTASDMKGGATTKSLLITVGSPTTFTISGTVTQGGSPLANVRVHNGLTLLNYRCAYTDSDGAYTITNLSAGNVTLSASLAGFTFAASGFVNPVIVGPNQNGVSFTATAGTRVSIEAVDASATEGGDTALLRLTRTGSTASALTVYVDLSQNVTGEYSLSPSPGYAASPLRNFTIPAGSSVLNVTVTASNDGNLDGTQVLQVSLMNTSAAYLATGPTTVAVTLNDDDINASGKIPPRVSIIIADAEATENNPADTAQFIARRTGDTTAALTVNFTVDTSVDDAASASDYAAIEGSVIIPAGSSSAPITIAPVDDSEVEGSEVVRLLLIGGPDYVADAQSGGNIKIIDDDIATVSITATDASANENGDPARFTFTRTGSTSAPLLIHYSIGGEAAHGVDYLPLAGQLTFAAGSSSANVDIVPVQDSIGEPTERVSLQIRSTLRHAISGTGRASITIADDGDVPTVTINALTTDATKPNAVEGPAPVTATFRVTTTGSGVGNITVNYTRGGTAISNVDFVPLSGSVTLGKNSTADITITPMNDATAEDVETVMLTLQPSASYTLDSKSSATIAILDDDVANIVSVSSNTTSLAEGGTGKFYFSRAGSTTSARTVNYVVSGTATNPADYTAPALTGTVTIPAASAGVYVDVISNTDGQGELTENIIVTLLPDPISPAGYAINSGTAALNIADADGGLPPIEQWRIAHFGAAANTTSATDLEDADFDGVVNLLEYALHRDPLVSDKPLLDPGVLSLTYQRVIAATDITYTVQWSPDLVTWNTIGIAEETLAADGIVQTIRATITPNPGAPSGFLRLKVTRN